MKRLAAVLCALLALAAAAGAEDRPAHLLALDLYAAGSYADCRGLVNRLLEDFESGAIRVAAPDMARVYLVAACIADVYRGAGYLERIEENVDRALALDPNVDSGIADTRPVVAERLAARRKAFLAAKGPTGRRFSVGLVAAVEGPGGISWRNAPLLGARIGVGLLPWLAIEAGGFLLLQEPPLDGGEVWIGTAFHPTVALHRLVPVFAASYVATRADTWVHGVTLAAGGEAAFASGWSLRGMAEILRADGIRYADPEPDYPSFTLFGTDITFTFPRLALAVAYSF